MSTQQAPSSRNSATPTLVALFFGVFVMGCAEMLVVGVLDLIAADLRVSVSAAGALVTSFALGIAIGGPVLTVLTMKMNKRTVLIGVLFLFAVANLVLVLGSGYGLFLAARFFAGAVEGLFIGVAFVTGISMVPPERAGRAISMIISGVTVSAAVGVPLGTLASQELGWRGSFTTVIVLCVVALIATVALVPSVPVPSGPGAGRGAAGQAKYAFAPRVLAMLSLNVVVFASLYTALTYIVPFLRDVTGVTGAVVSVFLVAYGVATAVGSFGGGRFADRNAARALLVATTGTAVALLALYVVGSMPVLVALVLLAWGMLAMSMAPSLQLRVVTLAGPGAGLASSLPASATNVGIAVGSAAGGVAISDFGPSAPVITAAIIGVVGIVLAWATSYLKPPVVENTTEPAAQPS
ncbi:MFS transporter [Actinophytocola algeriensis]|uniref:DHA1 family inner membrane transport protein n=1 Tax=Actinophytocola algeriensis TaxID=1768010 RepID=A0A7W7Q7V7_9PSEU|nr:MFS transporter [Actinophytocola algeriensis]MBB4908706.1 DHA1 family inner membrane transport protein [Actinophytocola algeriensis]MBE1474907.1 DHA1 family inner membrane transport protein [Actinophytocola algeriensis]